jgi:hypothetical protein
MGRCFDAFYVYIELQHIDDLSPSLNNFAVQHIMMFQVNREGWKLNATDQLVYAWAKICVL